MATVSKEVREVFEEAMAIGQAHTKELSRHRNFNERLMARAAENVYAAHLVEVVTSDGFTPVHGGEQGRQEVVEVARKGQPVTAKAYALLIGYSEAYVSRLYRLGFAMAAGVLDPNEKPTNGKPTRWQQLSRSVGDTPEVGKVLGKDVDKLPTPEAIDAAIEKAQARRASERAEAAALKREAEAEGTWMPSAPSEQIGMLEELSETVHEGRHLTAKQIDRLRAVLDTLSETVQEWVIVEQEKAPEQKAS